MQLSLRKGGKLVLNRALGHARGNAPADARDADKLVMTPETPVCLFSASKAVTAILTHKLAEEGGIDLDAPVARYWPAFGRKGKALITVRDVLSHRAGIPGIELDKADRAVERLNDWEWICDRIANSKVGRLRMVAYHAITGGFVLGEIIQRRLSRRKTAQAAGHEALHLRSARKVPQRGSRKRRGRHAGAVSHCPRGAARAHRALQ